MKTFELNNKQTIPAVGFGVFMIPNDGPTYDATLAALKAGYRHIDTAAGYCNESDVGKAIKDSGIDRSEIFITSKLWLQDYGYENAKKGIDNSLKALDTDYIDLYLLHQPYGDYLGSWRALEEAVEELTLISGQKPIVTTAKKSIAGFKVREGQAIGCKVTLRGERMYEFLDKLVSISLPRVRDFRGVPKNSFDGRGNYTLGVKEQLIFPEIDFDKVAKLRGMDIVFVTTAKTDEEGRALLTELGMPFAK